MIKRRNLDPTLAAAIDMGMTFGDLPLLSRSPTGKEGWVYYVNQDGGSDAFDGLTPEEPLNSIEEAITRVNARINWSDSPWAQKDVIYVYPGVYAENLTSLPYGAALIGLGQAIDANGEFGVKIKPASGAPVDCTSIINCLIRNIWFESPDASVVFQTGTFNRAVLRDCFLQGLPGASNTTTIGFETETDVTGSMLINVQTNQCSTGFKFATTGGKQFTGCLLDDIRALACETFGINITTGTVPSATVIRNSLFGSKSMTCADPYNDEDASPLITCYNNIFVGTTIDPATGSGYYNNCYHNGSLVA